MSQLEEKKSSSEATPKSTLVYTWGVGRTGELGHENLEKSLICPLPQIVDFKFKSNSIYIKSVSCSEGISAAISSNGDLYTWGISYKTGHGIINQNTIKKPKLVEYFVKNNLKIQNVSLGECHCGVITNNNNIYLWGKSQNGCIGDLNPKTHNVLLPIKLNLNKLNINKLEISYLCLGWKITSFIIDGNIYTFGCSTTKLLGYKCDSNQLIPKKINISSNPYFINISVGSHHACGVTKKGNIYSWGNGKWGNLGHGNKKSLITPKLIKYFNTNNIFIVSSSCTKGMLTPVIGDGKEGLNTFVLDNNGLLYSIGSGHKGKSGNLISKWTFDLSGKEDIINKPYLINNNFAFDIKNKKTGYFKNEKIINYVSSALHSGVVTSNGNLYTFGCGSDGRMGLNAYVEGSCGSGKQVFKFYVSKPTAIETFVKNKISIKQCDSSRRHMIALGSSQH